MSAMVGSRDLHIAEMIADTGITVTSRRIELATLELATKWLNKFKRKQLLQMRALNCYLESEDIAEIIN